MYSYYNLRTYVNDDNMRSSTQNQQPQRNFMNFCNIFPSPPYNNNFDMNHMNSPAFESPHNSFDKVGMGMPKSWHHQHHQPTFKLDKQHHMMMNNQRKEFRDFSQMPTMNDHCQNQNVNTNFNNNFSPAKSPEMASSSTSIPTMNLPPRTHHRRENSRGSSCIFNNGRNLFSSFIGNYRHFTSQPQQQRMNNSQKWWFNKKSNQYQNRGKDNSGSDNVTKNHHNRDRKNVKHDIQEDLQGLNNVNNNSFVNKSHNQLLSTVTTVNDTSMNESNDPPFLIYSLEEFPAIVSTIEKPSRKKHKQQQKLYKKKCQKMNRKKEKRLSVGDDFVIIGKEASISTPPFEPPKISLCEKIIRSPKKLIMTTTSRFPLKPILKLSKRSFSECSDDWIEFAHEDCSNTNEALEEEEEEECTDSESDDDDDDDESDRTVYECSEESEVEDVVDAQVHQIDSGFEEKHVRFSTKPKVHVMRVWDYAYRAYRKGDYWQQFARDNDRFKKRIQEQEKILEPILLSEHRDKIFKERFQ